MYGLGDVADGDEGDDDDDGGGLQHEHQPDEAHGFGHLLPDRFLVVDDGDLADDGFGIEGGGQGADGQAGRGQRFVCCGGRGGVRVGLLTVEIGQRFAFRGDDDAIDIAVHQQPLGDFLGQLVVGGEAGDAGGVFDGLDEFDEAAVDGFLNFGLDVAREYGQQSIAGEAGDQQYEQGGSQGYARREGAQHGRCVVCLAHGHWLRERGRKPRGAERIGRDNIRR